MYTMSSRIAVLWVLLLTLMMPLSFKVYLKKKKKINKKIIIITNAKKDEM